ncbi:MAG: hypothetical protein EWV65_15670 [Microcystis flos-aquae Ma_QC_C_20070823_S18D]|nr:MAG: hypothetical protein EWV65_15670 [Microcystis flos-aquae Ma_QC_C_20070823_S18D]
MSDTPLIKGGLKGGLRGDRHPPLIKGGLKGGLRGDRHPPYQGGQGGSNLKSIFNLIITSYLSTQPIFNYCKTGGKARTVCLHLTTIRNFNR